MKEKPIKDGVNYFNYKHNWLLSHFFQPEKKSLHCFYIHNRVGVHQNKWENLTARSRVNESRNSTDRTGNEDSNLASNIFHCLFDNSIAVWVGWYMILERTTTYDSSD